jgi:hypothetical protein
VFHVAEPERAKTPAQPQANIGYEMEWSSQVHEFRIVRGSEQHFRDLARRNGSSLEKSQARHLGTRTREIRNAMHLCLTCICATLNTADRVMLSSKVPDDRVNTRCDLTIPMFFPNILKLSLCLY